MKSGGPERGAKGGGRLGLPVFGTTKTHAFSSNVHSNFASVVLDGVLGPPHLAHELNQGLKGRRCQLKNPFKGP